MSQRTNKIIGWSLTGVLGLLLTMSAFMKLTQSEMAAAQATAYGMDAFTSRFIGLVEIGSLLLFIIPRTGVLGTLMLAAYMGGAIVTHLQHNEPAIIAVAVETLVWITAFLRFPELKQRLLGTARHVRKA